MTDSRGGATNVLERLDQRAPTRFYWSLTLLATVGGFLFGYDTANIGSALNFVPYPLTGLALGYLVSGTSLGAAAGALLAGPLTDRFGRKSLLIADAVIYAAGALLAAFTPTAAVLVIARTLIGLAIGADSAIATAYIAEYAPRNRRGSLGILQQWMITVGILVSYLIALVIFLLLPSNAKTLDWRLIFGLGAVPALIAFVLRARMPESPRWLLRKGHYDRVQDALAWFGVHVTRADVEYTARVLQTSAPPRTGRKAWTPGVRRALVVVCGFFAFQQITGINVPLYYGPHLLGPLFQTGGNSTLDSTIAGVEVTAVMTVVNVAATYFAFRYIDRLGRRTLSIGGFTGMAVSALVAAAGLGLLDGTARIVVTTVGLCLFIACFAIGVGGTGWLLQGEVFPTDVRGQAAAAGATVDWLANFAVIMVVPVWEAAIGLGWVMVCFAALCVFAVVFVRRWLPETKGRSVEEITEVFEQEKAGAGAR